MAAANVDAFHDRAGAALAAARGSDGLLYGEVGRQILADCGEDIVFVTVWRDLDSLYRWMGHNDLLSSALLGDGHLLERLEVQHYETWGEVLQVGFAGFMQP